MAECDVSPSAEGVCIRVERPGHQTAAWEAVRKMLSHGWHVETAAARIVVDVLCKSRSITRNISCCLVRRPASPAPAVSTATTGVCSRLRAFREGTARELWEGVIESGVAEMDMMRCTGSCGTCSSLDNTPIFRSGPCLSQVGHILTEIWRFALTKGVCAVGGYDWVGGGRNGCDAVHRKPSHLQQSSRDPQLQIWPCLS